MEKRKDYLTEEEENELFNLIRKMKENDRKREEKEKGDKKNDQRTDDRPP